MTDAQSQKSSPLVGNVWLPAFQELLTGFLDVSPHALKHVAPVQSPVGQATVYKTNGVGVDDMPIAGRIFRCGVQIFERIKQAAAGNPSRRILLEPKVVSGIGIQEVVKGYDRGTS
jgi:hypothetical protein